MNLSRQVIALRLKKGIAAIELAVILPLIVVMAFAAVEFGFYLRALMIASNVSREGGSLVTRGNTQSDTEFSGFFDMLQSSGVNQKLFKSDLSNFVIYASRVRAAAASGQYPSRDLNKWRGSLAKASDTDGSNFGLSTAIYNRLTWKSPHSDVAEIWVVEVYAQWQPILFKFIGTTIVGSKSVF